ncbi:protein kinase [Simkania negevensis]|uniref:non-specific serine/threonine protein kinase n=1 Tax=Simkania negevensis TaxID=83561 RepID=A0ABS3AQI2_9BACT|nr:protein kinase [Simkania negevensis]
MSGKIVVKGYTVGSKIDQSGLKKIHKALDIKTGKEVFMTLTAVRRGRALNALARRAAQSQKLSLPSLVTAIDHGLVSDQFFYYTHSAVSSFPLEQVLEQSADEVERYYSLFRYFLQALEVVDYIHEAQTTHRDLNTRQLRVTSKKQLILEGFINSRPLSEPRNLTSIVHFPYMAPEQLLGANADKKTDIYSVGVIFYELFTGSLPYDSNYAKLEDFRNGVAPNPTMHKIDVPKEIEAVMMKMLGPRESRYKHTREVINDIEILYSKRSLWMKMCDLSASVKNLFTAMR